MQFQDVIKLRNSIRDYKSDAVEKEKLDIVLEAARLAPTAANRQPFRMIVIETKNYKQKLLKIYNRDWFVQAPLVICACAVISEAWTSANGKNYAHVDTTIAMDHLILAARDLGLGTCWIAAFDPNATRSLLQLPVDWEPVAFTPLGYPTDSGRDKRRKNISDIIRYVE